MRYSILETPIGRIAYAYDIVGKMFKAKHIYLPREGEENESRVKVDFQGATKVHSSTFSEMAKCLQDFFEGSSAQLPMSLIDESVCGPFQLKVLHAERAIPRGKTASYAWVARSIGSKAYRAVGNALARNPFPIVVPCHRAVRSDRTLGGFQGGLEMKKWLLKMENVKFDHNGRVHPDFFVE
jgi:methylated-DNA-[protein]-cysteine S-methyltransferase